MGGGICHWNVLEGVECPPFRCVLLERSVVTEHVPPMGSSDTAFGPISPVTGGNVRFFTAGRIQKIGSPRRFA